jgi:hypothetical protein
MMAKSKLTPAVAGLSTAALVTLTLGSVACSDLLGSGSETASISFRALTGTRLALSGADAPSAALVIPVTAGGHTVDVQLVDLLVEKVKLERVHVEGEEDSDSENEADSDSDNDESFRDGPVTIELPISGGLVSPFSQTVPTGTYDELQMRVQYVRVRGTYDGQAFDVTTPVNAHIETSLNPPLVVSSAVDEPNVTVNVDVLSWFQSNGVVIDPRQLASDSQLASAFRSRVKASFRALKDNNQDGEDSDSR